MKNTLSCLLLICLLGGYQSKAQIITTIAGNPGITYFGDGGAATAAKVSYPSSVVKDIAGNIYISDCGNHRIRMVSPSGIISNFCGNGIPGYSGDGGPATAAQLSSVDGICLDGAGNLYLADAGNNRIRKIDVSGIITSVAGIGAATYGGDGGPATAAYLNHPTDVVVDPSGNLYIADRANYCVRMVNASGIISTVAGVGTLGFGGDGAAATLAHLHDPTGVAIDAAGNLYIADQLNGRVRKVNTAGIITTIAGSGTMGYSGDGGPATAANLYQPIRVAVDAGGNVMIADMVNNRIRKVNTMGIITTIAGTGVTGFSGDGGPGTSAQVHRVAGLFVDGTGNIYFADALNNRVRKLSATDIVSTIAGTDRILGDGGPATAAELVTPSSICVDASGNVYVVEVNGYRIRKITPAGIISTYAGNGIDAHTGDGGPATAASLLKPGSLTIDAAGNLYTAEYGEGRIRKITPAGIISTIAGNGTWTVCGDGGPATDACISTQGLTVDAGGNFYLTEGGHCKIRKINASGIINTIGGTGTPGYSGDGGPATSAEINYPWGIRTDSAGNVFFAEPNNDIIRKITSDGIMVTVAGTGINGYSGDGGPATAADLRNPGDIVVAGAGNLLVVDGWNHRIRLVDNLGNISTIAGTGVFGYAGDGGAPTSATLGSPSGITMDAAGNIYIVESGYAVVRKISGWVPPPAISGIAENGIKIRSQISPNPVTSVLHINSKQAIKSISIINITGQKIMDEKNLSGRHVALNVAHCASGIYFVKVNESEVLRFVKE